jgi:hypothetical protein
LIEESNNAHPPLQVDSKVKTNLSKQNAIIKPTNQKASPKLKKTPTRNTISLKDRKMNLNFPINNT